jgi:hypothetical protein
MKFTRTNFEMQRFELPRLDRLPGSLSAQGAVHLLVRQAQRLAARHILELANVCHCHPP